MRRALPVIFNQYNGGGGSGLLVVGHTCCFDRWGNVPLFKKWGCLVGDVCNNRADFGVRCLMVDDALKRPVSLLYLKRQVDGDAS